MAAFLVLRGKTRDSQTQTIIAINDPFPSVISESLMQSKNKQTKNKPNHPPFLSMKDTSVWSQIYPVFEDIAFSALSVRGSALYILGQNLFQALLPQMIR